MSTVAGQLHAAENARPPALRRAPAPSNTVASDPSASLRNATDDEILASTTQASSVRSSDQSDPEWEKNSPDAPIQTSAKPSPSNLEAVLAANPELRQAWEDVGAYRRLFATPEAAREATTLMADLNRMDALFFSRRAEDHAELARAVSALDPAAFKSLARAMAQLAAEDGPAHPVSAPEPSILNSKSEVKAAPARTVSDVTLQNGPAPDAPGAMSRATLRPPQENFFHATNDSAVRTVIDAIEAEVQRLLPESTSKGAQNRVVGEIYRELDNTLRSNRQLAQQVRDAFRSGNFDDEHRAAVVSLIAGRARQALPGVAKRVLNEWTSTIVAANHDRRSRQRAAERRVDIAGSGRTGNDGHRPLTSRDLDYARMSDADILNL